MLHHLLLNPPLLDDLRNLYRLLDDPLDRLLHDLRDLHDHSYSLHLRDVLIFHNLLNGGDVHNLLSGLTRDDLLSADFLTCAAVSCSVEGPWR